jgi:hypothetical protein
MKAEDFKDFGKKSESKLRLFFVQYFLFKKSFVSSINYSRVNAVCCIPKAYHPKAYHPKAYHPKAYHPKALKPEQLQKQKCFGK